MIPAPETTELDETEITEVAELARPGETVTVGIAVKTVLPPIVALNVVGVPAKTPVKIAEYVPFPLSVVVEKVPVEVPPEFPNKILDPPTITLFPAESRPCKVAVTVFPELTVAAETVTTDEDTEILPGTTVTVGSEVDTLTPLTVAPIVVAVPATIPVKEAE